MKRWLLLVALCFGPAFIVASLGTISAQQAAYTEVRISEATGLPIIYPYHGVILNHDLREIQPTEENVKYLVGRILDGIEKNAKASPSAIISMRSRVQARSEPKSVETLLNIRIAAQAAQRLEPAERAPYLNMLRVIETWSASTPATRAARAPKSDPKFSAAVTALSLPTVIEPTALAATPYIEQCRKEKVPIPPDWGTAEWQFQGVLEAKYTFSAGADGPTEVWAATGKEAKGVCMALPRKDLKTGDVVLLGIICQSKETGKACFWDNIDRKTGDRLDGAATARMKIASIQDGSMLAENCTNCHRGYNAFPIHPGSALDIGDKFALNPDQRYQPISGQTTWGNPAALIEKGSGACAACHEIPALRDDNNSGVGMPSAYCKVVLEKAANLTMPYIGSPAKWDSPKPAYAEHINYLRALCESQIVAKK